MAAAAAESNDFLADTTERGDLNQYWFSRGTIGAFVAEIADVASSAALVSSPSVYFSLPEGLRARCKVFDYDRQWESDPGYVFYDFNDPEAVPAELRGAFDLVLVDPPFITYEVWAKYAATTKALLRENGRVMCTTIAENAGMMRELLGLRPALFRPSIPSLVYQYSLYTNFESARLSKLNPEVDDEDWRVEAARLDQSTTVADRPCNPAVPVRSRTDLPRSADLSRVGCITEALPLEGVAAPLEEAMPAEVHVLVELRERLNALKRATEAVHAALEAARRRRMAGGEAPARAAARAEAALDAAGAAAADLAQWASGHGEELVEALGVASIASARTLEHDKWHTQPVLDLVARARGTGLDSAEAYPELALAARQHAAALFRRSSSVLDRIKALKRAATAASGS